MAAVQSVYQYWKQFDLPTLQKELDEKATDLANRQDESETSRKKLVDLCRDFKKTAPEDVKKVVTPVLKCFQSEVDSLSKRSKAAEAAFLSLYKKIIDSADPTPALEAAIQMQKKSAKAQDFEIENANLRETLNQYNQEFAEVKNQEITIRQLKEKIKTYDEQIETIVKNKLVDREAILSKNFDDKEKKLTDNETLLQSKLIEAESRADSLEKSLQAAQRELFSLKSRSDELGSARCSEMDFLVSDLEKANMRAAAAEEECELLKGGLKSSIVKDEPVDGSADPTIKTSIDVELAAKDRQVSQLLDEITQVKCLAEKEAKEKSKMVEEVSKQLVQKSLLVTQLEDKLSSHKDYDEIKRELSILKSIYLGSEEDGEDSSKFVSPSNAVDSKSLETLLLEKNKSLQLEKTSFLSKKRELETTLSRLENEHKHLTAINEQQKQLIFGLEEDLMRVQSLQRPETEGSDVPGDQSTLDLISDAVGFQKQSAVKRSLSPTNAESLLPIVANQRERLRMRVEELEEANMQNQQHAALLNGQIERLRSDNVKLYEKIKFLQSYQAGNQSVQKSGDEIMNKYSGDYEASLDPFRRFGVQERQRRYMALSTHDKATLSISRLIINNPIARALFFFYLIFLHCLVFLVLYKLAYTESCQRDSATECIEKYREHMQLVHGKRGHDHGHVTAR